MDKITKTPAPRFCRPVPPTRLSLLNLDTPIVRRPPQTTRLTSKTAAMQPMARATSWPTLSQKETTEDTARPPHYEQDYPQHAAAFMRQFKNEIALRVHAHDDNNRISERDPSVCLNYVLLKQWCMMNGMEMYDIDEVLN